MRTPGGFDSETGAPIASGGGGFDPDAEPEAKKPWWYPFAFVVVAVGGLLAKWCGS